MTLKNYDTFLDPYLSVLQAADFLFDNDLQGLQRDSWATWGLQAQQLNLL